MAEETRCRMQVSQRIHASQKKKTSQDEMTRAEGCNIVFNRDQCKN
ncbi:uncharacterized protein MEPE_03434 [Melanopsichium pennsylvanicum]|uniref:Uncharacterized protein n=1 Tax=Melanopsichium pennsylvanicum TaxID=63383 RepID=A0AAJ4XLE5_9BASI|nr:uncharacterized protein MEPE_03434 [Melanopsichium pennsylvanicum]